MKFFLFVSDISTLIGVSKFNIQECFERYFKKFDRELIERIENEFKNSIQKMDTIKTNLDNSIITEQVKLNENKITKRQYDLNISKISKEKETVNVNIETIQDKLDIMTMDKKDYTIKKITKVLPEIKKEQIEILTNVKTQIELKTQKENISLIKKEFQGKIEKKEIDHLINNITSIGNTNYGTNSEMSAIELFEKQENVKLNTSQDFYKIPINKTNNKTNNEPNNDLEFYLGGKVDGLHKNYIVEVKNRTRNFFYKTRDYENIQVQLYMYILNYPLVKLVEKYNGEIRITTIKRNDELLEEIMTKITILCNLFEKVFQNKLEEYFKLTNIEREEFINKNFYQIINKQFLQICHEKNSYNCNIEL